MNKPFSQACENNKAPILEVLLKEFDNSKQVLEIGSGTGQHAVFLAPNLAHLIWQTSDMPHNHDGINAWISELPADNLKRPLAFSIGVDQWPDNQFDAVFTANTAHIMQPDDARLMMQLVADNLPPGGVFCQYGPFNLSGEFTSDSNRQFDLNLRVQGYGGIRDIDELQSWVGKSNLRLVRKYLMPANNQILVWQN